MSRAKPISCVAISIVIPSSASSRITSSTAATSSGSSALVTSSSSSSRGCIASARMIATRCCWPPDSRSGYSPRRSARPNRSSSAIPCSSASRRDCPSTLRGPSVMLSSTVMCGNRLNDWNTIPMLVRILFSSTSGAVTSTPPTTIRPAVTGSIRLMQRSSVDLPEPEAPIRQITSCSDTARSMPRSTSAFPKLLRTPSISRAGSLTLAPRTGAGGRGRPASP